MPQNTTNKYVKEYINPNHKQKQQVDKMKLVCQISYIEIMLASIEQLK